MKGWYRENWRHSLAAKGIRTRMCFAKKPLITNEEIAMIQKSTKKNIGELSDSELASHVGNIREKRDVAMNIKGTEQIEANKVDYLEPFRSPEEKSSIGNQMVEQKISNKIAEIENYMDGKSIDFEDKKRIMDYYVNPLVDKFRKGNISEREFDSVVDSKVRHNSDVHRKDTLGAFDWAREDNNNSGGLM